MACGTRKGGLVELQWLRSLLQQCCRWERRVPHETQLHVHLRGLDGSTFFLGDWAILPTSNIYPVDQKVTFTWEGEGVSLLSSHMSTQTLASVSEQRLVLGHLLQDLVKLVPSVS